MKKLKFENSISIECKVISDNTPAFIVAEAGVNHNGDMELAKEMIDVASDAGADAVKFQAFKSEHLILKNIEKAPYQKKTTGGSQSQYDMLKKLEISKEKSKFLQEYCRKRNIIFLSTPFEEVSLSEICELNIPAIKVAATDATNLQYLKKVAATNKPIFFSAGMCYAEEIRKALQIIEPINRMVILMHCTANYPASDEEVNLNVFQSLKNEFDILLGYSDHTVGIGAAPYAVAAGAKVIEKHFTLDKNMEGPDHKASVNPKELERMVKEIRRAELYLGSTIKMPTISEQFTRKSLQKCFVAKTKIKQGELFEDKNIVAKRTGGNGISAIYYCELIGKRASKDYYPDDII